MNFKRNRELKESLEIGEEYIFSQIHGFRFLIYKKGKKVPIRIWQRDKNKIIQETFPLDENSEY